MRQRLGPQARQYHPTPSPVHRTHPHRRTRYGRGDIVTVDVDPASGHGQRGTRPAPVLSTSAFNALGTVLVAPITEGGDFARQARRVETAPEFVIEDALARLRALTE